MIKRKGGFMQFIDLKAQYSALKDKIDASINAVLEHGQFIMGKEVVELEEQLAEFIGAKYAITCANGTDALQLLFMAYGVGKGDAVFCPDITFISSVEPAVMLGATPVFCDITQDTYNLCPQSLERQIKAVLADGKYRPKAVVAVDFLGNPASYDELTAVCEKYSLILINDAAQSFGAEYKGKKCGNFGHSAITSFFPAKPLGCYGDGGAIFTNDDEIAAICLSMRVHGKGKSKYDNVRIGVNSRLDTIQAAILLPKLKALKEYEMDARQKIVQKYNAAFKYQFTVPFVEPGTKSAYAQYALLAKTKDIRDRIVAHLDENKIPNMIYYPTPQHELPVFSNVDLFDETFANSLDYCARTFSLPMHPYLTKGEQNLVIKKVLEQE